MIDALDTIGAFRAMARANSLELRRAVGARFKKPGPRCPGCKAPLADHAATLEVAVLVGLECCGYFPTNAEAWRWVERLRTGQVIR